MIGVPVREQDRIQFGNAYAKRLHSEIGRGIDHDVAIGVAQPDGRAKAVIPRVGGCANIAMATDGRNADTGAGAEDGEGNDAHATALDAESDIFSV